MPMVWGLRRICLMLPADASAWPAQRRRVVLLHELAHVSRRDSLAQFVTSLACAFYWFNPLVWIAAGRMAIEREQACDDLVLSMGIRACDYADHLLAVAALAVNRLVTPSATAMARPSTLECRLRAILDATRNRRGVTAAAAFFCALLVILALPVAMLRPQARGQQSGPTQAAAAALTSQPQHAGHMLHFVQIVVGTHSMTLEMTFQGQPTNWDKLPALLAKVPDRQDTVLCLAIDRPEMDILVLQEQQKLMSRVTELARTFGFASASYAGYQRLGTKAGLDQPSIPWDEARRFIALLAAGRFEKAESSFTDKLRTALPAPELKRLWSGLEAAGGAFQGQRQPLTDWVENFQINVWIPCTWDHNQLYIEACFDKSGQIAGLWTRPILTGHLVYHMPTTQMSASGADKDINAKIAELKIGRSTLADVLRVLGVPLNYDGGDYLNDPPAQLTMQYTGGLQVVIFGELVKEIRVEKPSPGH